MPLHRFVVDSGYSDHFTSFDLPHSYVRRKPKSYDGVIDYDMDNEDVAWLNELRENTQVRSDGVRARLDGAAQCRSTPRARRVVRKGNFRRSPRKRLSDGWTRLRKRRCAKILRLHCMMKRLRWGLAELRSGDESRGRRRKGTTV